MSNNKLNFFNKLFSVFYKKTEDKYHKTIRICGLKLSFAKKIENIFVSIGRDCHTAMLLSRLGLKDVSYPMDWLIPENKSEATEYIETRIEFLINNFKNFFNKEDLVYDENILSPTEKHYKAYNRYTGFVFWHDFVRGIAFDKQFKSVEKKYKKRAKRLIKHIKQSKNIYLVYMSNTWDHIGQMAGSIDSAVLETMLYRLNKKYKNKNFQFLIFEHDNSINKYDYKKIQFGDNITKYISNHSYRCNEDLTGTILSIEKIFKNEMFI